MKATSIRYTKWNLPAESIKFYELPTGKSYNVFYVTTTVYYLQC